MKSQGCPTKEICSKYLNYRDFAAVVTVIEMRFTVFKSSTKPILKYLLHGELSNELITISYCHITPLQ